MLREEKTQREKLQRERGKVGSRQFSGGTRSQGVLAVDIAWQYCLAILGHNKWVISTEYWMIAYWLALELLQKVAVIKSCLTLNGSKDRPVYN